MLVSQLGQHQNLIRRDLTAAQRRNWSPSGRRLMRRCFRRLSTAQPGAGGQRVLKFRSLKPCSVHTAAKGGRPAASVARDATRAKALGPGLERIDGTPDKGAELTHWPLCRRRPGKNL